MKIVYFGSGPVAARSLELLATSFEIEAVITKPRPVHHKGDVPVLRIAENLGLQVHTMRNRHELDDLLATTSFESSVGVLIDFGIIVSHAAIAHFPHGIINSHFSILPEWRGADPITFALLSGQTSTGVSLMRLVPAMDEGPLLGYGVCENVPSMNAVTLTERLIQLSFELLKHNLPLYLSNGTTAPQSVTGRAVSYSRKLQKEDGTIDWTKPAAVLEREIRAYIAWPGSRTVLAGKDVTLTSAMVTDAELAPGLAIQQHKQLVVGCGEQALIIERLKPAGKAEMTGQAFLAGYGSRL